MLKKRCYIWGLVMALLLWGAVASAARVEREGGRHLGKVLDEVSHADTSWSSWRKSHPDTLLAD